MRAPATLVPAAAVGAAFVVLVALGIWQLDRLAWKQSLIATIEAQGQAEPRSLREIHQAFLAGGAVEFAPVRVDIAAVRPGYLKLFAGRNGVTGWRVLVAVETSQGDLVMLDRGFVPADRMAPEVADLRPAGPIVGHVRLAGRPNRYIPDNEPENNVWYWRDVGAMARALSLPVGRVLPFIVMQKGEPPPSGWPLPDPLPPKLVNNHLGYALTWFGLALALAGVAWAFFRKQQGKSST